MEETELTGGRRLIIAEDGGERLDSYLPSLLSCSRAQAQRWIGDGSVLVNGAVATKNCTVRVGDRILVTLPEPEPSELTPEPIPLDIVYEDASILVVNKPVGMVVHPAPGNMTGTLVHALLYHLDGLSHIGGVMRPGIVHRLDKMTSGLIVIAKNDRAHEALSLQFQTHSAHRDYVVLVHGNLKEESGCIDAPIGRHPIDRKRMAVIPGGRRAVTNWSMLERYGCASLLLASLETGRTHQIRVHMAHIKHPVLGDPVYGSGARQPELAGQALHGFRLTLQHPDSGQIMRFFAAPPDSFSSLMTRLGSDLSILNALEGKP